MDCYLPWDVCSIIIRLGQFSWETCYLAHLMHEDRTFAFVKKHRRENIVFRDACCVSTDTLVFCQKLHRYFRFQVCESAALIATCITGRLNLARWLLQEFSYTLHDRLADATMSAVVKDNVRMYLFMRYMLERERPEEIESNSLFSPAGMAHCIGMHGSIRMAKYALRTKMSVDFGVMVSSAVESRSAGLLRWMVRRNLIPKGTSIDNISHLSRETADILKDLVQVEDVHLVEACRNNGSLFGWMVDQGVQPAIDEVRALCFEGDPDIVRWACENTNIRLDQVTANAMFESNVPLMRWVMENYPDRMLLCLSPWDMLLAEGATCRDSFEWAKDLGMLDRYDDENVSLSMFQAHALCYNGSVQDLRDHKHLLKHWDTSTILYMAIATGSPVAVEFFLDVLGNSCITADMLNLAKKNHEVFLWMLDSGLPLEKPNCPRDVAHLVYTVTVANADYIPVLHDRLRITSDEFRANNNFALTNLCEEGYLSIVIWAQKTYGLAREDFCLPMVNCIDKKMHTSDIVHWISLISGYTVQEFDFMNDAS